jgi:carboxyl-terminal processing protease
MYRKKVRRCQKNQAIQETIHRVISDGHFSPKDLNDDFSKKVFDKYLEMTDYGKLFFLQQDIDEYKKYEQLIDDEIKEGKTSLFNMVNGRIKERMKQASAYYTESLKEPFTYSGNEVIELDGKKLSWCANEAELKQRWLTSMKYRSLARFAELKEQQKSTTDQKEKEKTLAQLEIDARENVKKSMDNYFRRLNKISESDRFFYLHE